MRATSAVVLTAAALALGGCGIVTDPGEVTPEEVVQDPVIDGAVTDAVEIEEVEAAFDEVAQWALTEGFPPELLDPQKETFTEEELKEGVVERMTSEAEEEWQELVSAAVAGDEEAADAVRVLRFFDIDEPTWRLPAGESSPVIGQRIVRPDIRLGEDDESEDPVLLVTFDHGATLEYAINGEDTPVEVVKAVQLSLVPAPEQGGEGPDWLIDVFDGEYEYPGLEE